MQANEANSLPEFLNNEKKQVLVLEKIIEALRARGEWGRHGLFAALAKELGFSAAYIGRVLTGRNPIRENFVLKMAEYLEVHPSWLQGEFVYDYNEAREIYQGLWGSSGTEEEKQEFIKKHQLKTSAEFNRYRMLLEIFVKIPFEEWDRALDVLNKIKKMETERRKSLVTPPPAAEE